MIDFSGLVKDEAVNWIQIQRFLESATVKLKKAEKVVPIDEQTGFQMAYDAMLRGSLAFMLSLGKRPRSSVGHHKVIVEFVGSMFGAQYHSLMKSFDIMRRKRNEAIYEPVSTITEKEAIDAIDTAQRYIQVMIREIQARNPQQKLNV